MIVRLTAERAKAGTRCDHCDGQIRHGDVHVRCTMPDLQHESLHMTWHTRCAWFAVHHMPCLVPDVRHAYKHLRNVASNPILAVLLDARKYIKTPLMHPPKFSLRATKDIPTATMRQLVSEFRQARTAHRCIASNALPQTTEVKLRAARVEDPLAALEANRPPRCIMTLPAQRLPRVPAFYRCPYLTWMAHLLGT